MTFGIVIAKDVMLPMSMACICGGYLSSGPGRRTGPAAIRAFGGRDEHRLVRPSQTVTRRPAGDCVSEICY